MMAELYGRDGGYCRGKGGSMHIADFSVGMLGANGVVAGGIPIACGAAQGLKLLKSDAIVACMFGDGAINRGPFLEGLNWAALYKLPVLFVCEDNGVAAFTRADSVTAGPGVVARAEACGVAAITVDGNDVMAVDDRRRRSGGGGAARRRGRELLHVRTYRLIGHTSTDAGRLARRRMRSTAARGARAARAAGEPARRARRCERRRSRRSSMPRKAEMADGARRARTRPHGRTPRVAYEDVQDTGAVSVVEVTLIEASRLAALQEMRRDPRVWVLGEDVARGGLWGQYKGFLDEFGAERVVSTPISESTIMGAGLGAALVGTRPIIEMRIFDFVMCAMDELVNQIAKVRYMFGGQAKPAVVVRMPHGMWRNSAAQHSQMLEAWFAHLPGVDRGDAGDRGRHRRPPRAGDPLATIRCCSSIRRICSGRPARSPTDRADPVRRRAQGRATAMPRRS